VPLPPPSPELCLRAWELYARAGGTRELARMLTAEGHPCSHETARQWMMQGGAAVNYVKSLQAEERGLSIDPQVQRYRKAEMIERDIAELWKLVEIGDATTLDIMPHLKWLYREHAKVAATDAPAQAQIEVTGQPSPRADIVALVKKTIAPEEEWANGR
jgi:hypothetical protein